jgi:tyrosine-protein kinase Etk/Wzc
MEEPIVQPQRAKSGGELFDSPEIRLVIKTILKNWWIVLSFAAVGYIIGYFYAYRLPDVYAAQTQLLLKQNDQINSQSIISSTTSGFGSYQGFVDNYNEIRVIQSYDLIKKVVDKLNINVSYYIEGRLRQTEVYASVPFRITPYYINPGFYEKEIDFSIIDKKHFRISYLKGDQTYSQEGNFGDDFINGDVKLHITKAMDFDPSLANEMQAVKYEFRIHNTGTLVSNFRNSLTVKNPDYTNIIEISLRDQIASRAVAFLDTLDILYTENTVNTQFKINANTLLYIDKEMNEVTGIMDTIEMNLEKYKEKKNIIISVDKDEDNYISQYNQSISDKADIMNKLSALNDLEQYIIEGKDPEFLPPSVYLNSNDDFLQNMVSQLYGTQLKIMGALGSSTEQNPSVNEAKQGIKRITTDLLTYINNTRKALNEKAAELDSAINSNITEIRTIPDKQRGFLSIQRQEDVNQKLYEFLLEKRATTIIEKAAIVPQTQIIETGRSLGVVSPDRKKIYYMYMIIGIVISLAIVIVRLLFYDRIENIQELKSKTTLPVLGEILSAPTLTDLSFAIEDNLKSPLTESFRTLRTNLQYVLTDNTKKVVLFTSNGPSEGKTFCSMNIAAILAKADKKVLLLEFDLHRPRIHKVLNVVPDKGLSTIIIQKSTIPESITPSPVLGLDVILCGPVPPNSSELVLSDRVKDIVNYGKEHYDYVIIDTPPLGFISDALILMKLADATLFVLNTKFANKQAINYIEEIVYANKIKNLGLVLNNVKRKKSRYYYRRYGSYGGYGGYGYGYGGYGGYGN